MTLAGYILILFWVGFLIYGIVSWAISKAFQQLNQVKIELDEIDRDNIN